MNKGAVSFSGVIVWVFLWAILESRGWSFEAKLFPWIVAFPMLFLALIQLAFDVRGRSKQTVSRGDGSRDSELVALTAEESDLLPAVVRARTASILAWILGFFASVWLIGFSLSVVLFLFLYLKLESGESWGTAVVLTLIGSLFFYGLFERALHLPLPQGQIFEWLAG
jgi:hypothetical protein